jgi:peptidyl-prolyl cis-trans isomerase B (cyclophilin B)
MKQLRLFVLALSMAASLPMMAQSRQVMIETTEGNILVTLFDDTPRHRDNFLRLCNEQFYDSLLFHRVIKNFMIQGGDPDSKHAEPGVTLGEGSTDSTIVAEFFSPEGRLLHPHKRGALAAAREGDSENPERRSSGCQFYIVWGKTYATQQLYQIGDKVEAATDHRVTMTDELLDLYHDVGGVPHLDGQYTVFGEVTEGLDVVDRIQKVQTDDYDRPIDDVRILRAYEVRK